jgi:hypothetical protein
MSAFEDEIKRRAENLRSAREAERAQWLERRRVEREYLESFRDSLVAHFSTGLVRFDIDEIEDDDDLELDDEINLILAETDFHFGTIQIWSDEFRFDPTSSRLSCLTTIHTAAADDFVAKLREILVDYLAAVEAEDEDE